MANISELSESAKKQTLELAFTADELEELKRAREIPVRPDEDCPEITPEQAVKFRRVNPPEDKRTKRL